MAHDVFISASSKDKTLADAACAALEREGIRCWIAPRDVTPGADWGAAIAEAIKDARVMLLIFTANANQSPQVKREVECAASNEITIVPVRFESVQPTQSFEYFLGNIHWLDALTPPREARLNLVAEKLKSILAVRPRADVAPEPQRVGPPALKRRGKLALPISLTAVAIIVAVAAFVWWQHRARGPVDRALVGAWEYRTQFLSRDLHVRYYIEASGSYRRVQFIDERGLFTVEGDKWRMRVSATGRVDEGTYTMADADTLTMTVSLLNVNLSTTYERTRRGTSTNAPLEGSWRSQNVMVGGCPWDYTLEIFPDHTYHFRMEANDSGTFRAVDGKWKATSTWQWNQPDMPSGSYAPKTAEKMEMSIPPFGMGEVQRVARL